MSKQTARRPPTARTITRILGIDIQVHTSWLISLLVLSYYAYDQIAPDVVRRGTKPQLLVAIGFGMAIAVCIVIHELSHSLVARMYSLPVKRITLFAFGGVSQIEKEAPSPRAEFAIAVAGPLASVVLATILEGVARALHPLEITRTGVWGQLGELNMLLAIFNLIPAFPMDGGRVLRSGLWALGSRARATRWAVRIGQSFAVVAMGGGFVALIGPALSGSRSNRAFSALWLILIGFFIFQAAAAAGRYEGGERPGQAGPLVPGVQIDDNEEER